MPDDSRCDNSAFCDGIERCDPTEGCMAGDPVACPDDGNPCTEDLCDEATTGCLHPPADGLPCDAGEGPGTGRCFDGECHEVVCGDGFVEPGVEECDSGPTGTVGCTSECRSLDFRLSGLEPEPDHNGDQAPFETDRAVAGLTDGRFVVVWTRDIGGYCGPPRWPEDFCYHDVEARLFTARGEPDGPVIRVNDDPRGAQYQAVVAALGDGFVVVWAGDDFTIEARGELFARAFDDLGAPLGPARQVNVETYWVQDFPTVAALPDGTAIAAWEGPDTDRDPGIFVRLLDEDGRPVGDEVLVSTSGRWKNEDPSLAVSSDGAVALLTWTAWVDWREWPWIAAVMIDPVSGLPLTDELELVPPLERVQRYSVSTTALPTGGFFAAWVRWDSGPYSMEGAYVSDDGEPGPPTLLLPPSSMHEAYAQPSVATLSDGSVALAWGHGFAESLDGWTRAIGGRLLSLTDPDRVPEPLTGLVALNTSTFGDQTLPHLAASGTTLALCFADNSVHGEDTDPGLVRCRVLPGGWVVE
jgi:hypothetical protein